MFGFLNFFDRVFRIFVVLSCIFYFIYHCLFSDQGLSSFVQKRDQLTNLKFELAEYKKEEKELLLMIKLMDPKNPNIDLLEEKAKAILGYKYDNEIVIML